jgi:hypothetical protein
VDNHSFTVPAPLPLLKTPPTTKEGCQPASCHLWFAHALWRLYHLTHEHQAIRSTSDDKLSSGDVCPSIPLRQLQVAQFG